MAQFHQALAGEVVRRVQRMPGENSEPHQWWTYLEHQHQVAYHGVAQWARSHRHELKLESRVDLEALVQRFIPPEEFFSHLAWYHEHLEDYHQSVVGLESERARDYVAAVLDKICDVLDWDVTLDFGDHDFELIIDWKPTPQSTPQAAP